MLDLIERVVHEFFSLSPHNLHVWLNISITFFFKMKASPLVLYLDEGLAIFLFLFFSLKNKGFALDFVF
jgi:hypothetical protein